MRGTQVEQGRVQIPFRPFKQHPGNSSSSSRAGHSGSPRGHRSFQACTFATVALIVCVILTSQAQLSTTMVPSRFLAGLVAPFAASASLVAASQLVPGAPSKVNATQPLGGPDSALLQHPADWSRDVLPIPVHSHNDYWRDVPILHALSLGVRSVESDVSLPR